MEHDLATGRLARHHRPYALDHAGRADRDGRTGLSRLLSVYNWMIVARTIDEVESSLIAGGEAFFQLSSAGHEGNAVLGLFLHEDDWLHLHYRSKGLLVARELPLESFFHDRLCTARSQSSGRQMSALASYPAKRVLPQNGPMGNHALHAVGVAAELKRRGEAPSALVFCSIGDGATQQGEVMEALTEAARSQLPILFLVEDNGFAISTRTAGNTIFSSDAGSGDSGRLLGLPLYRLDGRDPSRCIEPLARIFSAVRAAGAPALIHWQVERLNNHSHSDDERIYRTAEEREAAKRHGDPIQILGSQLLARGVGADRLEEIKRAAQRDVAAALEHARKAEEPEVAVDARAEWSSRERRAYLPAGEPGRTMREAIREVLRHRLEVDPRVSLFGEDIEDPKGDIFGVTRGLSTAYPGCVVNSALSESLIVGISIGRALAGGRPVAFIQFADFLPLAFNQIHCELGSLFWRSVGGWSAPVIIMAACGGYRPGMGPFHSQTMESTFAHTPGLDVVMPSTAADAAGLLQAAFESPRPTLFLYPKTCLNDPDRSAPVDIIQHRAEIGRSRTVRSGDNLTMVAWGSTMPLCERAADVLAEEGIRVDLIDLRSISPWDRAAVRESVNRTRRLLVVHEDNLTCGFGAEVVADVSEAIEHPIKVRRVTRPDTYVPFHFESHLRTVPSFRRILTVAAEMLELKLEWPGNENPSGESLVIEASGSSPADQTICIVEWRVREGDEVRRGDALADLEADKALYPVNAPAAGRVEALLVAEGQRVRPGTPILKLTGEQSAGPRRPAAREDLRVPRILRNTTKAGKKQARPDLATVYLSRITAVTGSKIVANADLAESFSESIIAEVGKRTGIESRPRLAEGETILDVSVTAAREALLAEGLTISDVQAIICSTTTPRYVTPSLSCLILEKLCRGEKPYEIPAFDVLAACTGYLYALWIAHDMVVVDPAVRVLVITAEGMSRMTDPRDFDTAILFGDAATATIVGGPGHCDRPMGRLHRPLVSAKGEAGNVVRVPAAGTGFFAMDGLRVYSEAVRRMTAMLQAACALRNLKPQDLSLVVPHQANAKILEDIRQRLDLPRDRLATTIDWSGNTSSSSIPLCLADFERRGGLPPGMIGLTAFGGGLTFGAALLEVPGRPE
jgi:2-oxoisovalerate dehydrogenase E1 component